MIAVPALMCHHLLHSAKSNPAPYLPMCTGLQSPEVIALFAEWGTLQEKGLRFHVLL